MTLTAILVFAGALAPAQSAGKSNGYALKTHKLLSNPPAGLRFPAAVEDEIYDRLNTLRQKKGLVRLARRRGLDRAARVHAIRMIRDNFFDHVDPDGGDVAMRVAITDRRGLFRQIGENLAKISPILPDVARDMHEGWVDSPGHYRNMIKPDFRQVGVGCAQDRKTTLCAQVFGQLGGHLTQDLPLRIRSGGRASLKASLRGLEAYGWTLFDLRNRQVAEGRGDTLRAPRGALGDMRLEVRASEEISRTQKRIYTFYAPTIVLE